MFRTAVPRTLLRTTPKFLPPRHLPRTSQFSSRLCTLSSRRPQPIVITLQRLNTNVYTRQQTTKPPFDKPNTKHEQAVGHEKLEPHPEEVSATSSVHPVFSEVNTPQPERDADMSAGIKADLQTIKDTFDLSEVPRQAYYLGLAGVLPYLATSLATIGCAAEINTAHEHATGYLMSGQTAEALLHILEPLQVGYGAVIISFLGAIHWGLEWANYGGTVGYPRYAIGVIAPAIAWPTTLLPVEYALIAQFFAFNFLYYADSRASRRGWAPPWYGTYRFVLTFIVGAAIVVSLIGRGEIVGRIGKLPGPAQRVQELREGMREELAREEEARRNRMIAQDEASDDEGSGATEEE